MIKEKCRVILIVGFALLVSASCKEEEEVVTDAGDVDGEADSLDGDAGEAVCPTFMSPDSSCTAEGQYCEMPTECGIMGCTCNDRGDELGLRWGCSGGHYCESGSDDAHDIDSLHIPPPGQFQALAMSSANSSMVASQSHSHCSQSRLQVLDFLLEGLT